MGAYMFEIQNRSCTPKGRKARIRTNAYRESHKALLPYQLSLRHPTHRELQIRDQVP